MTCVCTTPPTAHPPLLARPALPTAPPAVCLLPPLLHGAPHCGSRKHRGWSWLLPPGRRGIPAPGGHSWPWPQSLRPAGGCSLKPEQGQARAGPWRPRGAPHADSPVASLPPATRTVPGPSASPSDPAMKHPTRGQEEESDRKHRAS